MFVGILLRDLAHEFRVVFRELITTSLNTTHMNEKENPGVLPMFTANFRGLNPKVKQIDHF